MYLLNLVQYFLMRPWRYFFTRPSANARQWWKRLYHMLLLPIDTILYVLSTPLRFVNAVGYNIVIYNATTFYDRMAEILFPRRGIIRYRYGANYLFHWILGLPIRTLKHGSVMAVALIESVLLTLWDTLYPTLTMYHGTSGEAAIAISQRGLWRVGDGNYAGSGLYFGISRRTARHYARWGSNPIIIKARVSLGFSYPLACAPAFIREALYGIDGDTITQWGRKNRIVSTEWWRRDTQWWEYALLFPRGRYIDTWRIRIIYIENDYNGRPQRVWGGKSLWLASVLK